MVCGEPAAKHWGDLREEMKKGRGAALLRSLHSARKPGEVVRMSSVIVWDVIGLTTMVEPQSACDILVRIKTKQA